MSQSDTPEPVPAGVLTFVHNTDTTERRLVDFGLVAALVQGMLYTVGTRSKTFGLLQRGAVITQIDAESDIVYLVTADGNEFSVGEARVVLHAKTGQVDIRQRFERQHGESWEPVITLEPPATTDYESRLTATQAELIKQGHTHHGMSHAATLLFASNQATARSGGKVVARIEFRDEAGSSPRIVFTYTDGSSDIIQLQPSYGEHTGDALAFNGKDHFTGL